MATKPLFLKNTTTQDFLVVGIPIPGLSTVDFSNEFVEQIQLSDGIFTWIAAGDLIVNDGTLDLSAAAGAAYVKNELSVTSISTIITNSTELPSDPDVYDSVFYSPFQSVIMWDGDTWVSPKTSQALFGRNSFGTANVWMNGINSIQTYPSVGTAYGYYIDTTSIKLYEVIVNSFTVLTGELEIHLSSALANPDYSLTGKAKVVFSNTNFASVVLPTPVVLTEGNYMQAFLRMTSGTWQDMAVQMVYSLVIQ